MVCHHSYFYMQVTLPNRRFLDRLFSQEQALDSLLRTLLLRRSQLDGKATPIPARLRSSNG